MAIRIVPLQKHHIPDIMNLDTRFKSRWSEGFYDQRISLYPHLGHAAYDNNRFVGFILGKEQPDGTVLISRVAVDKKYEKRGIGTQLMHSLEKSTPTPLVSSVRVNNIPSIKLHEKTGFFQYDTTRYSDNTLGIKMKKYRR